MTEQNATPATKGKNMIELNGQDFKLLPLNWRQLKERREDIIMINGLNPSAGMFTEEQQDAILRCVTASLQRSRGDIKEDFVADHLDLGNVGPILKMVFGAAKEPSSSGEAQAATSQT